MEPIIKKIFQICIVTADVKAMMKRYEENYGIGPWQFTDGEAGFPPEKKAQKLTTRGVPGNFEISIATAKIGDMEIELIQPLDDVSDYARFLKEKGEGVHHVCVTADNERLAARMKEQGIDELMSGTIPGAVRFVYYDATPDIGLTLEVLSEPDL